MPSHTRRGHGRSLDHAPALLNSSARGGIRNPHTPEGADQTGAFVSTPLARSEDPQPTKCDPRRGETRDGSVIESGQRRSAGARSTDEEAIGGATSVGRIGVEACPGALIRDQPSRHEPGAVCGP